jgi:S-DNA-T family DNA segregation ATPase FtsK/SpoIIIE
MLFAGRVSNRSPEISLPRRPEPGQPYSFPLIAVLAPVVGSLAMWAITRSPFALLFAVLGPVVALGSLLDSRLQARRLRWREKARFASDVRASREHIEYEKKSLRAGLDLAVRSAAELVAAPQHDPERWRYSGGPLPVTIGRGTIASGFRISEPPAVSSPRARRGADEQTEAELTRLRAEAQGVDDAPVIIDARLGIAVCGAPAVAEAVARGLVVQLAAALSPDSVELLAGERSGEWSEHLPHNRGRTTERSRLEFIGNAAGFEPVIVVVAERTDGLPRDCRVVLGVSGSELAVLRHPSASDDAAMPPRTLRAQFISRPDATRFSLALADAARREGLGARRAEPPEQVTLQTLALEQAKGGGGPTARGDSASRTLAATFAVGADGPVTVDLVASGPHAVIGGTTGSGKSELLISWVLAMAGRHPPDAVTFLLVDFKGGSSFGAIAGLAHCVGLITDLDQATARRALESLRAELRYRERTLAERGARSIDELADGVGEKKARALPRLVVVVDEFAAMIADFPELHALFSDIAARGRSLGVHLILCTQRPAGVLRDSVMANCTLRVSLRVNNAADSSAVIGSPEAAALPALPLGRCLVSEAGGEPRMLQVALAGQDDIVRVAGLWPDSVPPRAPWCPPLPSTVSLDDVKHRSELSDEGIGFGLLDLPEEQRQAVSSWRADDGNLLVLGGRGSGKSTLLATLARSAGEPNALHLPPDVEGCWDLLARIAAGEGAINGESLLLMDDVDAVVSRFPETHQHLVADRIATILRDSGSLGVQVAVTAQRLTALVHSLAPLCDARLLLRMPTRQDHAMAGGEGSDYEGALVPGAGWWRGRRAQVAWVPAVSRATTPATRRPFDSRSDGGAVVVTSRPQQLAVLLGQAFPGATVTTPRECADFDPSEGAEVTLAVADPQQWQAHWAILTSLRQRLPLVFDRCTPAEFRAVSGSALIPPPLSREPGGAWMLGADGRLERVQLHGDDRPRRLAG